ncbi:3-deoxy-D-manno-octulosonic-acid transferase [Oxalobacteraceae bacterium GrIS 2.11]
MRHLYTLIWICALPLVLARLYWRGHKEPGYRLHIGERFGSYPEFQNRRPVIWIHAVSVGETRAAEPLVRALMQTYPQHAILLSHMTPTGRATGATLFQKEIENHQLIQCFLPYDIPLLIRRLLKHFKPVICILMETEVWPNLIDVCHKYGTPVTLVNARLSPKSFRKAERIAALIRPATAVLAGVAAQTDADAQRIRQLGAPNVIVTGNSKFDVSVPEEKIVAGHQLRQQWGNRPVLLCASTREGEEELILDACAKSAIADLLLVIVPRHPQRFDLVGQLIQQRGLASERRSASGPNKLADHIKVVLGDTMGEMISYYVSCDIAFIGGSLLPLGGQNLIEACAVGKPVLIGPHTFNFEAITSDAISAQAAIRVEDADELFRQTAALIQDIPRRNAMGKSALAFALQHRGATTRTMVLINSLISAAKS